MQNGVRHLRALKIQYRKDVWPHDLWFGGMKQWVDEYLPEWQAKNPDVKVELSAVVDPTEKVGDLKVPRMVGYYLNGTSRTYSCKKFDVEAIDQMVAEMRNTCNDHEARPHQDKVIETHTESIQGRWTPFLWMKDTVMDETVDHEDRWKRDIKDIARFVRLKKEHREAEFEKKNFVASKVRSKMEKRWAEDVFPYTVGDKTEAVPGRLHLEETRSLFQESGGTARESALEGSGSGFMGGFTRPWGRSEDTITSNIADDKYVASTHQSGGSIPPFAGAPFSPGYDKYENYWKNWDLFNYSSQSYQPLPSTVPARTLGQERRKIRNSERNVRERERQGWDDNQS